LQYHDNIFPWRVAADERPPPRNTLKPRADFQRWFCEKRIIFRGRAFCDLRCWANQCCDVLVPLHPWTDELDYFVRRICTLHLLAHCELQDSDVGVLARLDDVVDISRRPRRIGCVAAERGGACPGHDDRFRLRCISCANYDEMCCARSLRCFRCLQQSVILNRSGTSISISARDDAIGVSLVICSAATPPVKPIS